MSAANLEARVAELESRVAELSRIVQGKPDQNAWKTVLGIFGDDPFMEEVQREATRIREEDRRAEREQGES